MSTDQTPPLPYTLAKDVAGDTLTLVARADSPTGYAVRAKHRGRKVIYVDPADLMRNLAAFVPAEPVAWLDEDDVLHGRVGQVVQVATPAYEVGAGWTRLYAHPPVTAEPEPAPGLFDGCPVDLSGSALVATVPGGRIRIVSGGGVTVEPNVTAPSVYQIVQAIAAHKHAVPNARELAEEIRALWSPAPGDADEESGICAGDYNAMHERAKKAEALAAHKQTVIDEDRSDAERNRSLQRAEVERYRVALEAAEDRIAALLRLDAATDDLHQADEVLSMAHDAVDAATEAEIETAKALNLAKAKLRGES